MKRSTASVRELGTSKRARNEAQKIASAAVSPGRNTSAASIVGRM